METTAHIKTYRDPIYGVYEVITVDTRGQFVPRLVEHIYADNYETKGTFGTDFRPVRENLDEAFSREGYSILTSASGYNLSGNLNEINGPQIKDGIVYHQFAPSSAQYGTDAIGFKTDGTTQMYSSRWGQTTATMIADGVVDCFSFGPTLVKNGVKENWFGGAQWGHFNTAISGRQALGQTKTGNIVIITTYGVTGVSGISGQKLTDLAIKHGCHNAIMLDGGGSAQSMINGEYSHYSSDASLQRPMPDFLGIRTKMVNKLDTGWIDLKYIDGASYPGTETERRAQARREGNRVYLRGRAKLATTQWAGNLYQDLGYIPDDLVPKDIAFGQILGTRATTSMIQIIGDTNIIVVNPVVACTWLDLGNFSYTIL